jgi:hypothetical protein
MMVNAGVSSAGWMWLARISTQEIRRNFSAEFEA